LLPQTNKKPTHCVGFLLVHCALPGNAALIFNLNGIT